MLQPKQKQTLLPPLSSLFQDSKGTNPSTETNNTSYESPTTQLSGAGRTRAWHYHESATPTSRNIFEPFLSEGRGGQVRLMKQKRNVLY